MAHVDMLSSWGPDLAGRLSQPLCSAGRAMYLGPQHVQLPSLHVNTVKPVEVHTGALADCQTCGWLYR